MSSTTDRRVGLLGPRRANRRSPGQVLAIFAFGLVGIIAIAALVFDVGQNLFERRKQQDAADAGALAGARWLVTPGCKAAPSKLNCPEAVTAALALTADNGYPASQVTVNIPPDKSSRYAGRPGHLQVSISGSRGSYFAGVLGMASFKISAMGVAATSPVMPCRTRSFRLTLRAANPAISTATGRSSCKVTSRSTRSARSPARSRSTATMSW